MRYGVWCPLPHTIRPEARMIEAEQDLLTHGAGHAPDRSFAFALDVLRRAEELGFETTLLAERWLGPDLPAWMLASALAVTTRKLELMVAVHPGIVQPQQAAKFAAALDRLSGGRAAINIVNGWWEEEFALFSNGSTQLDEATRYARMEEYIRVMRGLWEEDPFDFHGQFYTVNNIGMPLKCVQRPSPPIYAGTRTEPGWDVISRCGDYLFVTYEGNFRLFDKNVAAVAAQVKMMRERAARNGRKIGFGMSCHVICAPTQAEAQRQAEELEAMSERSRIAFIASKALGPGLVGTPALIAERLRAYEAAGVDTLMLHFHPMLEGIETFAQQIMPQLAREAA